MQKIARFKSLVKIPAKTDLVKGIKNGHVPPNAVAGGNGTFVVRQRAKLFLKVKCVEDGSVAKKDIYIDVKKHTTERITNAFCERLEKLFEDFEFMVEDGYIINIDEALENLHED